MISYRRIQDVKYSIIAYEYLTLCAHLQKKNEHAPEVKEEHSRSFLLIVNAPPRHPPSHPRLAHYVAPLLAIQQILTDYQYSILLILLCCM